MKTNIISTVFAIMMLLGFQSIIAQNSNNNGAIYVIGKSSNGNFEHLNFPKKNFIIKRGGIANMKSVEGVKVKVLYSATKNGRTIATIKRVDGHKFFRAFNTVTAELDEAISSGELRKPIKNL